MTTSGVQEFEDFYLLTVITVSHSTYFTWRCMYSVLYTGTADFFYNTLFKIFVYIFNDKWIYS